jgi:hypothetical protein
MAKRCDFCGTKNLSITKYKCTGKDSGKTVTTTVRMCICCDANTDKEWLAEKLCLDEISEMTALRD